MTVSPEYYQRHLLCFSGILLPPSEMFTWEITSSISNPSIGILLTTDICFVFSPSHMITSSTDPVFLNEYFWDVTASIVSFSLGYYYFHRLCFSTWLLPPLSLVSIQNDLQPLYTLYIHRINTSIGSVSPEYYNSPVWLAANQPIIKQYPGITTRIKFRARIFEPGFSWDIYFRGSLVVEG